jgi:hypothetical protein
MLTAPQGLGCDHCERGHPITTVESKYDRVRLCLSCTLGWFPQWGAGDFEDRHAPLRDHVDDKLAAAIARQTRPVFGTILRRRRR